MNTTATILMAAMLAAVTLATAASHPHPEAPITTEAPCHDDHDCLEGHNDD